MKILSIGNSFSQDAHRYLSQVAAADGVELTAHNLYIGGCSLEQHWNNAWRDAAVYDHEINGETVGKLSILQGLRAERWDVITLQQVSHLAGIYSSYMPFLPRLVSLCRQICPEAQLWLQQTWAYETDAAHDGFANYQRDQQTMHEAVREAYHKAARIVGAGVIPVGDTIRRLRQTAPAFDYPNGGISLCRDGFHLSLDYGRYAAALTWFATLTGRSVAENGFAPPETDEALLAVVRRGVEGV